MLELTGVARLERLSIHHEYHPACREHAPDRSYGANRSARASPGRQDDGGVDEGDDRPGHTVHEQRQLVLSQIVDRLLARHPQIDEYKVDL